MHSIGTTRDLLFAVPPMGGQHVEDPERTEGLRPAFSSSAFVEAAFSRLLRPDAFYREGGQPFSFFALVEAASNRKRPARRSSSTA